MLTWIWILDLQLKRMFSKNNLKSSPEFKKFVIMLDINEKLLFPKVQCVVKGTRRHFLAVGWVVSL